jgi:hypothetical protein
MALTLFFQRWLLVELSINMTKKGQYSPQTINYQLIITF